MKIVITQKGLDKLPGALRRFRAGIIQRVEQMLDLSGKQVVGESRENFLSGPRPEHLGRVSGHLASSVTYKVTKEKVVIGTNLVYGRIHELGGTVHAKSGGRLIFRLGNGEFRSAQSVTIPARPFLRPALDNSISVVKGIVKRLTDQALKEAMA